MVALVDRTVAPTLVAPSTRFTAMVVATDPGVRTTMVSRLRHLGAQEVLEAGSATEARHRGRHEGTRDLVVVDGDLADAPAVALVTELRANGWRRVLLMSHRDDPYHARGALAAGVRGYVVVPRPTPRPAPSVVTPLRHRGARPDQLSGREVEVLALVAEGRSNNEIGVMLGLSGLTVKSHLARIARKLGTGDRAEMVALALRAGLIP